jgi:hypothetical protein
MTMACGSPAAPDKAPTQGLFLLGVTYCVLAGKIGNTTAIADCGAVFEGFFPSTFSGNFFQVFTLFSYQIIRLVALQIQKIKLS